MPMAEDRFASIWNARIGVQAAAQLRRSSYMSLVLAPVAIVAAIACGILASDASAAGAIVAGGVAALCFATWIQSRLKLASELSEWFGMPVAWHAMPRMRAAEFDRWRERKGLQSPPRTG
jgi:hypothetical protein